MKVISTILSNVWFLTWHFPTFGLSAASLALVALEVHVCFQASIYAVSSMIFWKLERNAFSTSSMHFFPQCETHTQQASLWFFPVWLVIAVFSSSSNFPFHSCGLECSQLYHHAQIKKSGYLWNSSGTYGSLLFLQQCRRALRISFPYTSVSAIWFPKTKVSAI